MANLKKYVQEHGLFTPEVIWVDKIGTSPEGWHVWVDKEYVGPFMTKYAATMHAHSVGRPSDEHDALMSYLVRSGIKNWRFNYDEPDMVEVTVRFPKRPLPTFEEQLWHSDGEQLELNLL